MAKIYISSTYSDLMEYRNAVYKSLRKMGHDVIAMEDYVADNKKPVDKCLTDVEMCDIYLGIFAWRYGYIPDGESASITELEYRHSRKLNKPSFIFLLNEHAPWSPSFMDSHTGAGDSGRRISLLRNELMKEKIVSFFDGKVDLAVEAAIAVYRYEREYISETKPLFWEYLLTIEMLKPGLTKIEKQYVDLKRGLVYRPYQTIKEDEILEWIRQKLDDLIALINLLKVSTTEELMIGWGKPGQSGDENKIKDATTKILNGCKGLLGWEVDLVFTRLPGDFEVISKMMQGWTTEYIGTIRQFHNEVEQIISTPDAEGTFTISVVFNAPKNIENIVPEVKKILDIQ